MPSGKAPSVLAIAAGIASFRCFPVLIPFASSLHRVAYHEHGPLWRLFLPILLECVLVWLLCVGLLALIRRWQIVRVAFWTLCFSFLPLIVVRAIALMNATAWPRIEELLFALGLVLSCSLLWLAWRSSTASVLRVLRVTEAVVALTAWSGAVLLGQAVWSCYAAGHAVTPPLLSLSPNAPPRPTVIWLFLDELSQDQLFDHRFPGLVLPAFDRFAAQSTLFSNVAPANLYTEEAVPALMTGLPVSSIEVGADGQKLTLDLRSGARQPFDPQQTIFGDAQGLGYPTSVAGWYNPYCRILPTELNRCTWVGHSDNMPGGFRNNSDLVRNLRTAVFAPLPLRERLFGHIGFQTDAVKRDDHIEEYRELESSALSLLAEPHPGFVMLHIPVPHPEGIYNRHTGALGDTQAYSYIDNLALADRFLGEVEETLSKAQQWDQATIVIMGDHSWRAQTWRTSTFWTPEDEIASAHGTFDPRPAYLVKLPGQHTTARVDAPYDSLRTRALFDQLLTEQIRTPEQLAAWAAHP